MKAALIERHGGPEELVYGDVPDPTAGPGEIVVDVHAASVNAADWKVRSDSYGSSLTFPYVLGRDFSGIVAELGSGVEDFALGAVQHEALVRECAFVVGKNPRGLHPQS